MTTNTKTPIIIAGPCSAESYEQVMATAKALSKCTKITAFRSGVWKPRSRPNTFEGAGDEALLWLKDVKAQFGFPIAIEVANPEHVEVALKNNIDVLWIGARTTSNPFSVQELASALNGANCKVMVKNPVNPDLELWIGAIERVMKAGCKDVTAIHRGFYPYEQTPYRNIPKWEIPIELKTRFPEIPIICDPSHIAGKRSLIAEVSQYALNLNFDGLMIESHINPDEALSDARQQLTPKDLIILLRNLQFRTDQEDTTISQLETLRHQIDSIDSQILELLSQRMNATTKIGAYKSKHNIAAFQLKRWKNIIRSRIETGGTLGLDEEFVKKMLQSVHKESIRIQNEVMKKSKH